MNNDSKMKKSILKCFICQKTENDFLELRKAWIKNIEKELNGIEGKKQFYRDSHGYTSERLEFLNKLNKKILNMKIDVFIEQKQELLGKESRLKFLYVFINKVKPKITKKKVVPYINTVKDIVHLYISHSENHPHVMEVEDRRAFLLDLKKQIKNVNMKFLTFEREYLLLSIMERQQLINISEDIGKNYYIDSVKRGDDIKICIFCYEIMNGPFLHYKSKIDSYFNEKDIVT